MAVQDPFDETRDCAVLALNGGAVATSSIGRRRWQRKRPDHAPPGSTRTGQPSDSDLHTVTVLADTAESRGVRQNGAHAGHTGRSQLAETTDSHGLLIDRRGREHSVGTLPIYTMLEIA